MVKNFIKRYNKWCFLAPFGVFVIVVYAVCTNAIQQFDEYIYVHIIQIMHPLITAVLKSITISGTFIFMLAIACIVFYKNHRIGKILLMHLIISDIISLFFKLLFLRERPAILRLIDIDGYSFPSGHAMVSLCFYGLCIYFLMQSNFRNRKVFSVLLIILILLIGISRVYLGVHYFSDILGGFLCGLSYLLLIINNSSFKT